jgi:hypothetical protein
LGILFSGSPLAKSINDAAWYQFREWIEYFGVKFGKITIAVAPNYTSQNCSNCGETVKKSLLTIIATVTGVVAVGTVAVITSPRVGVGWG